MHRKLVLLLVMLLLLPSALANGYIVTLDERMGLCNEDGTMLCALGEYDFLAEIPQGRFAACSQGTWQVLDAHGISETEEYFDAVRTDGSSVFFEKSGRWGVYGVTDALYSALMERPDGGYFALLTDPMDRYADTLWLIGENGVRQSTGTMLLYGLNKMVRGRMRAVEGETELTGYLDEDGHWAIKAKFLSAEDFCPDGLAVAAAEDGKVGVIDRRGAWLIEPKYERITHDAGNSLLCAMSGDGRVTIYNGITGAILWDTRSGPGYGRTMGLHGQTQVTLGDRTMLFDGIRGLLGVWQVSGGASVWDAGSVLLLHTDDGDSLLSRETGACIASWESITAIGDGMFLCESEEEACVLNAKGEKLADTGGYEVCAPGNGLLLAWDGTQIGVLLSRDADVRNH